MTTREQIDTDWSLYLHIVTEIPKYSGSEILIKN